MTYSTSPIFYTGCRDTAIKKSAEDALSQVGRAHLEIPGPMTMSHAEREGQELAARRSALEVEVDSFDEKIISEISNFNLDEINFSFNRFDRLLDGAEHFPNYHRTDRDTKLELRSTVFRHDMYHPLPTTSRQEFLTTKVCRKRRTLRA